LVDSRKILYKYLDKEIQLFTKQDKLFEGALLSFSSTDLILKEKNGGIRIVTFDDVRDLYFPSLPEGLITKPTLVWLVNSESSLKGKAEVSYLTGGINWHAEYVAVTDKDDKNLDLSGWVSIDNHSGATYQDAKLKLMAGEVRRVEERVLPTAYLAKGQALEGAGAGFEEKPFFEYHLYTLQRRTTLKDNEIKQVSLFSPTLVKAEKILTYDGARDIKKIRVNLEFVNSEKSGLGIPLPQGKIRVYKKDVDGSLEFIGEDKIDHTPKDEKVRVYLGNAFDVVGERAKTDFRKITDRISEESYRIKLRNHKEEKTEVVVIEHFYAQWEITKANFEYVKKDATTIEAKVSLDKNEEKTLEYTVRYSY
ncbi:MAG: DUF4139 domain-containing protein, partial [candidate division Zixibacteria bacterium]|nr:DUF4139 domain-containing protein [candidate division Zixibacteria bacterium]